MRTLLEAVLGTALLLLGIFQPGCSVNFNVTDETGKVCILADLSIDFNVAYKSADKQAIANLSLPNTAVADKASSCGAQPVLVITFSTGYSLHINFNTSDTEYLIDQLQFTYNLSDVTTFPGSVDNGTSQVSSNTTGISAKRSNYYQCSSPHLVTMGNVNATFHNVKLQAYFTGTNYSGNASLCKEDVTPTSTPTTAPRTSAPTSSPTTQPVTPGTPETGEYKVNGSTGSLCIFAKMGLQLIINYTKDGKNVSYEFNIDPNKAKPTGSCSNKFATLQLDYNNTSLWFNFVLNATDSTFYLGHVNISTDIPDEKERFVADNGSLSYLKTTTHKSYKCDFKQTFQITDNFSINTYKLQVQAFDIDGNKFGPAVECAEDQNGMLVPIVVGAALAGLVLIVLIAYLIGRKRSHAGYQTI